MEIQNVLRHRKTLCYKNPPLIGQNRYSLLRIRTLFFIHSVTVQNTFLLRFKPVN